MRTTASNSLVSPCAMSVPGAGSTLTVTVLGVVPSLSSVMPVMEKVLARVVAFLKG